jgi:hypothetical protein
LSTRHNRYEQSEKIVEETAHATAMRRKQQFMNEKKNLILGLISTKQENKGNFKKKFKAKKQRLTIEN